MGGRSQSMRTFKEKLELGARSMQASRGRVVVPVRDKNEEEMAEDTDAQEGNERSLLSEELNGDVDELGHRMENSESNPKQTEVDAVCGLQAEVDKTCMCCGTTKTAQWRTGPLGRKTLCNACGVRFSRARYGKGKKRTRGRKRGLAHESLCMDVSQEDQGEYLNGSSEDRNKAVKDGDAEVVDSNQPDMIVADSTVGSMPCTPHAIDKACLIDFQKGSEQSSREGYFRNQAEKEDQEIMPPYGLVPPRPVVDAGQSVQSPQRLLVLDSHTRPRSGKSKSINALVKEALKDPAKVPVIDYHQSIELQQQEDTSAHCNVNPEINLHSTVPVKIYQPGTRKRLALQNPQSSNTTSGKPIDEGAAARERYFNLLQLLRQDRHASLQSKMTSTSEEKPQEGISAPVVFTSGVQSCGVSRKQNPRATCASGAQAQWTADQSLATAMEHHSEILDTSGFDSTMPTRETLVEPVVVDGGTGRQRLIMGLSSGSVEATDIQSALGKINESQHRVQGAEACVAAVKKVLAGAMQEVYSAHEELHAAKQNLRNLIGDIDSRASTLTFNNTTTVLE